MHVCYIDESGTPEVPGTTSHFILAGLSIPIWHWHDADREIREVMSRYDLKEDELHTAWLLRPYIEQSKIPNFEKLGWDQRRTAVRRERNAHLLRLQKSGKVKSYRQAKKNFKKTDVYIHLTRENRKALVSDVAKCISAWGFARLFAECVDKLYFEPSAEIPTIGQQAFEQVISRFEHFLSNISGNQNIADGQNNRQSYGIIVHDNNPTIAKKHTQLMKDFHAGGTLWTKVDHVIETPLFVDSELTRLVQAVDLCSYALRRFLENGETALFNLIFKRADRVNGRAVGVRHFSEQSCTCEICRSH